MCDATTSLLNLENTLFCCRVLKEENERLQHENTSSSNNGSGHGGYSTSSAPPAPAPHAPPAPAPAIGGGATGGASGGGGGGSAGMGLAQQIYERKRDQLKTVQPSADAPPSAPAEDSGDLADILRRTLCSLFTSFQANTLWLPPNPCSFMLSMKQTPWSCEFWPWLLKRRRMILPSRMMMTLSEEAL